MKQKLFVALTMGVVLYLVTGASDAATKRTEPERSTLSFNHPYGGVFEDRFEIYEVSIERTPTRFLIDRKTGCEFMLTENGGIQPTTPLDQCPKENIKPYNLSEE